MKLASLWEGGRDGRLILVEPALKKACYAPKEFPTLQCALEQWDAAAPMLSGQYAALCGGKIKSFIVDFKKFASPLPRAYQWLDGSAYLPHVERVRKSRGAEMPPEFYTDPLMYQGGSDHFLGPCDDIPLVDEAWGLDLEAEIAVVTDDVPLGVSAHAAGAHIKLIMLANDISLRNLIPAELAKGFGFVHGKPPGSFSPAAVTPDELGDAWDGGKVHLPLKSYINGELLGEPNAGEDMQFNFPALIAHAAKTRALKAGTIIGSGTVANKDTKRGCSCLLERRVLEIIEHGKAHTPFLKCGDRVRIEMSGRKNGSVFGAIDQKIGGG